MKFFVFTAFLLFVPFFIHAQSVDITVGATVYGTPTESVAPSPPPGVGGSFYVSPYTQIIFKGQAYPFANLTILKNNVVITSFKSKSDGFFEKEINGLPGGTFVFSIFAEDSKGRISPTLAFVVPVLENRSTLISRIFIPPTIDLSPIVVARGEKLNIFGQVFPGSSVNMQIFPKNILEKTESSLSGAWNYEFNTNILEEGEYVIKAAATDQDGAQSDYSKSLTFSVVKSSRCQGPDLNFDGRVDLVDFSILLYFWGQKNPKNSCADINGEGIVDIIDFSIMMYYWNDK